MLFFCLFRFVNAGTPIVIVENADSEEQEVEMLKKNEEKQDYVPDGEGKQTFFN